MLNSKRGLKVSFLGRTFKYEFNSEKSELKLLVEKEEIDLATTKRLNIREIMSIKNELIILEDKSLIWHIKECEYCLANEIKFIIDYTIELYSENFEITTVELKSTALDSVLHPANYFYHNRDLAKNDILYDIIEMKKFDFNFEKTKIDVSIYVGDLLKMGICSKLTNSITLSLNFQPTNDIKKICNLIDYVRNALKILLYSNDLEFNNIELRDSKKSYIGRIFEMQRYISEPGRLDKSNKLYFNNIMNKIFNNIDKLDVSKLSLIKVNYDNKDYCMKLINLFAMFESNFKLKFKKFKSPKIDIEQAEIIDKCVEFLSNYYSKDNNEQFIESLKNRIKTYNNSSFSKLRYAMHYYCQKLIIEEKPSLTSFRLKWLYYKNWNINDNINENDIQTSAKRLQTLRNTIVHTEEMPLIEKIDKFWIDAFELVVYAMMLDNLGLTDDEILEHFNTFF